MGKRKAVARDAYEPESVRREKLKKRAVAAAASYRRTGHLLGVYDRPDVIGSMIAQGLVSVDEMRSIGARLPKGATARIRQTSRNWATRAGG
jgi:hypothetical protein